MEMYRQGDVFLCPVVDHVCQGCGFKVSSVIGLPSRNATLAYGEVTGHAHKLQGLVIYNPTSSMVKVLDRPATFTHEDHGEPRNAATNLPVKVQPGSYHVHQQQVEDYSLPKPQPRYAFD